MRPRARSPRSQRSSPCSAARRARQADAILERLLPGRARLTGARYRAVLREFPKAVAPSLDGFTTRWAGRALIREDDYIVTGSRSVTPDDPIGYPETQL